MAFAHVAIGLCLNERIAWTGAGQIVQHLLATVVPHQLGDCIDMGSAFLNGYPSGKTLYELIAVTVDNGFSIQLHAILLFEGGDGLVNTLGINLGRDFGLYLVALLFPLLPALALVFGDQLLFDVFLGGHAGLFDDLTVGLEFNVGLTEFGSRAE